MTAPATFLQRCTSAIEGAELDPKDCDAVFRALVERGIHPDHPEASDLVFIARASVAQVQGRAFMPHIAE